MRYGAGLLGALLALTLTALAAQAAPVTHAVQQACADDYYKHCAKYQVGTPELRACMQRVGNSLSQRCIQALVDGGHVSKAQFARPKRPRD